MSHTGWMHPTKQNLFPVFYKINLISDDRLKIQEIAMKER